MLKRMELKEGAGVFTPEGKQVGKINRFVLDPATNEVTHIVVQKGWLLAEDKVVPLDMVHSATDEKVVLDAQAGGFDQFPPFEEKHFIRVTDEDFEKTEYPTFDLFPAYYWYPPQGYALAPGYVPGGVFPSVETRRNIPPEAIPLKEGAKVITSNDKHVGDVERLFVESDSNHTTHIVVKKGLLLKERKVIPAQWVKSVGEETVHLTVTSQLLERLPAYES